MEPGVRDDRGEYGEGGGERGFSLIEVLVVVAILGLISTILTLNIGLVLKRQRLETAAEQFNAQVRLAQVAAAERSRGSFIVIHANGDGTHTVWMVSDTNGDNQLGFNPASPEAGPDMPVPGEQLFLTEDIVFPPEQVFPGGLNNWPVINGNFVLLCDPRGLPFNPATNPPLPFTGSVRISLTHREMVLGSLHPRFRFDITISPLWHSTLAREMY